VDNTPPTLTLTGPAEGLVTKELVAHVTGTATGRTAVTLTVNGAAVALGASGAFATDVAITEGANTLTLVATNAAGLRTTVTRHVARDTQAPVVMMASPSDQVFTKTTTVTVRGTVTDASAVTVTLNGVALVIAADGTYQSTIALSEGLNTVTLVATDAAGNATTVRRSVTLDTTAPVLSVTSPADGITVPDPTIAVTGTATDANAVHVTVNGTAVTLASGGAFTTSIALTAGANTIAVIATDSASNTVTVTRSVTRTQGVPLPPDPSTVATPLSRTAVTPFSAGIVFLYTGTSPIQTGVAAGAISQQSGAVIRGVVKGVDGLPVSGVVVSSVVHADYGTTLSRQDGAYDFLVNGGEPVAMSYVKAGYSTVQRRFTPQWGTFMPVDPVVMTALDTRVTQIDFTRDTIARATVARDASGTRQATMLFRAGTTAQLRMPNGSTSPLSTVHVRATELTVGPSGLQAMPGPLPSATAYTYAVDLTADEALAAGATSVEFSKPVSFYVDNFLRFPVGFSIPVGYYDRVKAAWINSTSGRVIRMIGLTSDSLAILAVDTTGAAASATRLADFGIDASERAQIAKTYAIGASVWRWPVTHFTPYDGNSGVSPPVELGDAKDEIAKREHDNKCNAEGSIIGCTDASLGETIPVPGSPFQLTYSSQRVLNSPTDYTIAFNVSIRAADSVVRRMRLDVDVAGKRFTRVVDYPKGIIRFVQTWDGRDIYGRPVTGAVPVLALVTYVVPMNYALTSNVVAPFGLPCVTSTGQPCVSVGTTGSLANIDSSPRFFATYDALVQSTVGQPLMIGRLADATQGFGGWRLNVHHAFDPASGMLSLGTGETRSARASDGTIFNRIAGDGMQHRRAPVVDGIPATRAQLDLLDGAALAADGSLYIVDAGLGVVRKVLPTGIITTVIGNGNGSASGDGGPARQAGIDPFGIGLGTNGDVYLADGANQRIRRVDANGIISTVVGNGICGIPVEGARADSTSICAPQWLRVGPDGALYFTQNTGTSGGQLFRVGADGRIALLAGSPTQYCSYPRGAGGNVATYCGNEGPARNAVFQYLEDLAFGADGSIYLTDSGNGVIRRIDAAGIVHNFAGIGHTFNQDMRGDGGLARNAEFGSPGVLAMGADGTLYIGEDFTPVVRAVTSDGRITTVVGDLSCGAKPSQTRCGNRPQAVPLSGPARSVDFNGISQLIATPDRRLLVASIYDGVVLEFKNPLARPVESTYTVASAGLDEYYVFDAAGKHLRTEDALTRAVRYRFAYGTDGLLESITDAVGATTQILRDGARAPQTILTPDGLRVGMTVDGAGYLRTVAAPNAQLTTLTTDATGLLQQLTSPNGGQHTFSYFGGRLTRDQNADRQAQSIAFGRDSMSQETVITSPLGRTRHYRTAQLPTGDAVSVVVNRAGLTDSTISQGVAQIVNKAADGTVTTTNQESVDPRFGSDALQPTEVTIVQPSGLTTTLSSRRTIVMDSLNPLSVVTIVDTAQTNGVVSTARYVAATRSGRATSAVGRASTAVLDTLSRVTSAMLGGLATTRFSYDTRGRLRQLVDAGRTTTFGYNALSQLALITDPLGIATQLTHDSLGRVLSVQDAAGTTAIEYDTAGNLQSLTPPGKTAHRFTYTLGGMLTSYQAPSVAGVVSSTTTYRYDSDQQLRALVRPDGDSVVVSYDAGARPSTIVGADATTSLAYGSGSGLLTSASITGGGTYAFSYDGALVTSAALTGGPVTGNVSYGYDAFLRRSSVAVNGSSVTLGYDADGLLTAAGSLSLSRSAQTGLPISATLDATVTAFRYDSTGALAGATTTANGSALYDYTLERDVLERIVRKVETIGGVPSDTRFAYDSAGRLTDVMRNGVAEASYQYDANGNRTRRTSSAGIEIGVVDAQDRLTSNGGTTYQYTDAGELKLAITGPDTTRYHYDAAGALRWVVLPTGTRVDYVIDPAGRRIGKRVNGVLAQAFLYESTLRIAAELTPGGAVLSRFVYGMELNVPEYMERNGKRYRFVIDHRGSVRLVVEATTGAVVQRIDYDEYGRVVSNSNPAWQPFGYAGGLFDDVTQLVRFGARDYDAAGGRFTQEDPIGLAGGMNLYGFAAGDPVNYSDPFGLNVEFRGKNAKELELRWRGLKRVLEIAGENGNKSASRLFTEMLNAESNENIAYVFADDESVSWNKGFGQTVGTQMRINVCGARDDLASGRASTSCRCLSISDIMIHEFGHALTTARFGQLFSESGKGHEEGVGMQNILRRVFKQPLRE
jgi:RHS repeat-associated protein